MEKNGLISPGDLELFSLTDDPKEAVEMILDYLRQVGPPAAVSKAFE
jgi:hypothetical protein